MGGSPVCLHRRKSTVIPGSDFWADPTELIIAAVIMAEAKRQTRREGAFMRSTLP
jgi:hypothetical protein